MSTGQNCIVQEIGDGRSLVRTSLMIYIFMHSLNSDHPSIGANEHYRLVSRESEVAEFTKFSELHQILQ